MFSAIFKNFSFIVCLLCCLGAGVVDADNVDEGNDRPKHGLMWKRSALPSVFPLQVKTRPGRNYHLLLRDEATDEDVLAAFIEGGRFFRVLVPPGTFRIRVSHGFRWQGNDELFGGQTEQFVLPDPLTFRVTGLRTKRGHIIDLTDDGQGVLAGLQVRDAAICQTLLYVPTRDALTVWETRTPSQLQWWYEEDSAPEGIRKALREAYFLNRSYRLEVRGRAC